MSTATFIRIFRHRTSHPVYICNENDFRASSYAWLTWIGRPSTRGAESGGGSMVFLFCTDPSPQLGQSNHCGDKLKKLRNHEPADRSFTMTTNIILDQLTKRRPGYLLDQIPYRPLASLVYWLSPQYPCAGSTSYSINIYGGSSRGHCLFCLPDGSLEASPLVPSILTNDPDK